MSAQVHQKTERAGGAGRRRQTTHGELVPQRGQRLLQVLREPGVHLVKAVLCAARDDAIAMRSPRRRVEDDDARDEDARVHVTVPSDSFARMSAFGDARARAGARERYRWTEKGTERSCLTRARPSRRSAGGRRRRR